ncbi:MAG: diaminohydroxyphosphoribosylaminopyrimidine deaminase [Mesorhizobium sp.]|nr:MAG: diaminohydroxyphosphoribosylaminopyrimidine deaminase [Mesorhizobium sp.]RWC66638.1 MAG: diaminohydroxyphosphoribosylaminopyrimidine deaminase [Mesorhizobium sp.]
MLLTRSYGGTAPPSALPGISPTSGEIGSLSLVAFFATSAICENRLSEPISPLVGEMSGRTEGRNANSPS